MAVIKSNAYWAPVAYYYPGDEKVECLKFRARFRRLKAVERRAIDDRLAASRKRAEARALGRPEPEGLPASMSDSEFLDEVLVGWDLQDADGKPVDYSKEERQKQVDELDGFEGALIRAWFEADRAAREAGFAEKNSAAPSATTSA